MLKWGENFQTCTGKRKNYYLSAVPLRAYLSDGDIHLTVLSNPCAEESWAGDVLSIWKQKNRMKIWIQTYLTVTLYSTIFEVQLQRGINKGFGPNMYFKIET
ncbi:hypothetical protein M9H77_07435 [Catharanthus roseus]|uniref:Uncharacterized protein n=1 Tax=Catharanthus roseus TaxID=4058 RepID=A0ACC0BV38_CATRO|nr:hypothetical protein M9H77_07435 [Catharanthus roseus]